VTELVAGIVVRDALDEDGQAICALIEPIFSEYEGVLFDLEEMPELLCIATTFKQAGGAFWCACRDDQVVGCIGWTPATSGNGIELKKLYVAKHERQHGLGRLLAGRVEQDARRGGSDFVELWSDTKFVTAHRFYQQRGYLRGGTRELHDKSDTVEYFFRLQLQD
jgi:putative acetyltransferase